MFKKVLFIAIFSIVIVSLNSETLIISTLEGSPISEICSIIITEVYKKAGLDISIVPMPAVRATSESTTGHIDGETHRIAAYGELHNELLIIPFSYYRIDTNLFTQRNNLPVAGSIEDLSEYKFAILKGVRHSQELTEGFPDVLEFEDSETMIRFLMLKRADVAILSRLHGMDLVEKLNAEEIVPVEPPVTETYLFHYVHKKHKDLVPLLLKTIKDMDKSGELAEVISKAEIEVTGTSW